MKNRNMILAIAMALALSLACLTGCGSPAASSTPEPNPTDSAPIQPLSDGGVLVLSVNPEIAVEYDPDGLVTGITARNDDALDIIAACEGLIGQETRTVVTRLVTAIGEAGWEPVANLENPNM